jgi:hypothetical protein
MALEISRLVALCNHWAWIFKHLSDQNQLEDDHDNEIHTSR